MYENIKRFYSGDDNRPFGIRFVGETICDSKFRIERQSSEWHSLEYIVDGVGTLEINGQVLRPKKGDIFLLTEGSNHKYYSQNENGWKKFFVSFYGELSNQLISLYLPKDEYLFNDTNLLSNFQKIFDIAFDSNNDKESAELKIQLEIIKIFTQLYSKQNNDEDTADKIKRYIDTMVDKELNLDYLCKSMNYSKNHIINIFSQKFKVTPYQYFTNKKIELAKDYLKNSSMTISEISNTLSYSDQQYFSYCFKKATGFSPRAYRKNLQI